VPVVASKVGGLIDFLVDNDNALLHEPRSPASIAAALTHGLWDASLRARLTKKALETVTAEFDERVLMDRYAQLIERAPGTRR
jgi:glycosyltransferase involved in cell wall biosynthesis